MTLVRRPLRSAGLALGLLAWGTTAPAQDTTAVVPDSAAVTQPPPAAEPPLPVPEAAVVPGPLPAHGRLSFTRDSLLWSTANTLADLLGGIPGVFVARAGFLGQPEYVAYAGRGGGAIELYWDGLPLMPLGGDSLYIEPGRIALSYLDRVDIEILPSSLRVFLVSARHSGRDTRSVIRVTSGDFDTSVFAGLFQKRWASGIGLNLAAHFTGTDGASGTSRTDESFDTWARLDWLPTGRTGATYQIRRQRQDRDPVDGSVPERKGARTDFAFSLFTATRTDGLGLRAEGSLASSTWTDDSLVADQRIRQASLTLRYRQPNLTLQVDGRLADARITAAAEARVGWVPVPGIVLSGAATWRRHEFDRRSIHAHARAGLFGGPFSLDGTIEFRDGLQAPSLAADTVQRTIDAAVRAGLRMPFLDGYVSLVRREAYQPLPFPDLRGIPDLGPSTEATFLVADVTVRTSRALSLRGWYSNPIKGVAPALQPPKHGRAELTFRSRFLRTFRSGVFDFLVQLAMDSWSTGTAGLDAQGAAIRHDGVTFYHAYVQFRLVSLTAFWNFRNGYNSLVPYVPGYVFPNSVQTFGVTWEFRN